MVFHFALARYARAFMARISRADAARLARVFHTFVAQISNLPYRRASSLRRVSPLRAAEVSTLCRLEIGDTAGWKPALRRLGAVLLASFVLLAGPLAGTGHAAALRITEFMAENSTTLNDEDGEFSDWIEIANFSSTTVDLAGWHLTDDSRALAKWQFPSTNLPPGGFLIVFASGKNRREPGAPLHTNFRLSRTGEYLGLIEPDGRTVAHHYAPVFPEQFADISFGIGRRVTSGLLLPRNADGRLLVPADGSLGAEWTAPDFDDASWTAVRTGIGYDAAATGGSGTVLNLDFNARTGETGAANTEPGFQTMTLNQNGSLFNGIKITLSALGNAFLDDRDRPTPVDNPPDFTQDQLYDDFIFANGTADGDGIRILIENLQPSADYHIRIWSFDSGSTGNRLSDWIEVAGGTTVVVRSQYTFNGSMLPVRDYDSTFTALLRSSPQGRLQIEGRRSGGTSHGVFLNALSLWLPVLTEAIETDVRERMHSINSSVYLRLPFEVADPALIDELALRVRYDDGFVAYLNGEQIAARNAPDSLQWNSASISNRAKLDAFEWQDIPLTGISGLLHPGKNVLVFHGLNSAAGAPEFLLSPELEARQVNLQQERYFTMPTPGEPNNDGVAGLLSPVSFSHQRGFFDNPFAVTLSAVDPGVEIRYTTNGSAPGALNSFVYSGPIPISGTTLLRAATFKPDYEPSVSVTHTYLFLENVLRQSAAPAGFPMTWQGNYPADYGMDPNVVNHPNYGATIRDDMRALPTLSIVSEHDNFWHPSTGIYVDATRRGPFYERAASLEYFDGDSTTRFQVNAGVQMQGNASRDNARTPKHSMRLLFKRMYGPPKLRHNWFGGGVERFNTMVLRACFTDSWPTRYSDSNLVPGFPWRGQRYRPEDSLLLRDQWVRNSLNDMGHLSSRGNYVHLYINGLYWGVYNASERLDAEFFTSHLGGEEEDWDVIVGDAIYDFADIRDGNKAAWNELMSLVNSSINTEEKFQAVGNLVELENLIDYMLLHFFAEAEDWPHHNWYAARRRANPTNDLPATKWIFLSWDQDIVLDQLVRRNRINVSNSDTPARIYSQLRAWPEFRRLFGDRIQKHLFHGGALAPESNIARLQALAAELDRGIVGESARWGDARRFTIGANPGTGQTFTRDEWWIPELQKLYTNFFPSLTATTIDRFRAANLYPAIGAPQLSHFGGTVGAGFAISMTHTNASGTLYYTLDGTDPRVYGTGALGESATVYDGPIVLASNAVLKARVLQNTTWSALTEASFIVDGSGTLDSDGDGMPDWWELEHGLNPYFAGDAAMDSDGDGMSNLEEFIAGTDPRDPESFLRITALIENGSVKLVAPLSANRSYTIMARDSLSEGEWEKVWHIAPGPARLFEWEAGSAGARRFYRIVTPQQ
jgi:hypothetical protein